MSSTTRVPGGYYCDVLPSGEYAALVLDAQKNGHHLQTHLGNLPLPAAETQPGPKLMFIRITNVGGFKIAGKSHSTDVVWEWRQAGATWTRIPKISHGVQGHIYKTDGTLFIFPPAPNVESQGIRWWEDARGGPVWGSPTYNPFTEFAQQLGVKLLYEWTQWSGITIGQGEEGGAVAQLTGGHRVLEPGNTRFIQFHQAGAQLSVAIAKPDASVLWRGTAADLLALPLYKPPTPIPPTPEPPVPPIPDHKDVVTRARAKYSQVRPSPERGYRITNQVAWDLRGEGAGMFYKSSGNQFNQRSIDVVIYKTREGDPSGKGQTFDVLGDAEGDARPQWARTTPTGYGDTKNWRPAIDPGDAPAPIPPDPTPPPPGDHTAEIHALTDEIRVRLLAIDRLV
jgi:hypothetical protein